MFRRIALTYSAASSMFTWPELERGIRERDRRESQLQALSANGKQRLIELQQLFAAHRISEPVFRDRCSRLKSEIVERAQDITFASKSGEREKFLRENGCVKISFEAIDAILSLKTNLVEMGAGSGHWARSLAGAGVDIVAYDNMQTLPLPLEPVFPVKCTQDTEQVIKNHSDRALLLVYPLPGDMALRCVQSYSGDTVIYCGEGMGGVNADDAFFVYLEEHFYLCKLVTEFERFGNLSFERMWILKRKGSKV